MKNAIVTLITGVILTTLFGGLRVINEGGYQLLITISTMITFVAAAYLIFLLWKRRKKVETRE